MSVFDLKPLTAQSIEDLKLKSDQLWEVKIDENIYGPFETLQLKHYSKENRKIMGRAYVSNMSVDDWRPFFDVREFLHEAQYNGPYWMLSHGRKSSPLSVEEIAKRIELGTITRHDEISEDDGRHWHRISSHPEFEAHFTIGTALPQSPQESSFQKSRQHVLDKLDAKKEIPDEKENIASLTHISLVTKEKTKTVSIDHTQLPPQESDKASFWQHYKVHVAVAMPVLAIGLYFVFSPGKTEDITAGVNEPEVTKSRTAKTRSKKDGWSRSPANYDNDSYGRSDVTQSPNMDDNYPTVIETHQDDQGYPDPEKEADQVAEIQDVEDKSAEHSLVQQPNRDPAQQDGGESLDATMNNEAQEPNPAVDQPVVEEVSDF